MPSALEAVESLPNPLLTAGELAYAGAGEAEAVALPADPAPAASLASRGRALLVRTEAFGPALIVAMVLVLVIAPGLAVNKGNPTGFVQFGSKFLRDTHPPAGAVVATKTGYDGQFYWALARDPLLLHNSTLLGFIHSGYRLDRVGYPLLADLAAAGQVAVLPWTLLFINVIAVIGVTSAFGAYAQRRGWSGWWGLGVGLLPGLQFAVIGDLSGAVATALMLAGLIAHREGRRWLPAFLLAAAALTREPMVLAVLAVAVEAGARWWPRRRTPGALIAAARSEWPVLLIPTAAFEAWQAYVHSRFGGPTLPPTGSFQLPPASSLLTQASHALSGAVTVGGLWDLACIVLIFVGIGAAVALLRRGLTAPVVAALLFGLVLLVLPFGSEWGYTRESAPLFATLLLAGLEQRGRWAIAVCIVVAFLGALVPLLAA
jgi:hypothetical protein